MPQGTCHHQQTKSLDAQVLSAVVRHFTRGMAPVSMVCKAKTAAHAWGLTSGEVRDMETVAGDFSAQYGDVCWQPFGHCGMLGAGISRSAVCCAGAVNVIGSWDDVRLRPLSAGALGVPDGRHGDRDSRQGAVWQLWPRAQRAGQ